MVRPLRRACVALVAVLAALVLSACKEDLPADVDPDQVDAVAAPDRGACRLLTVADLAQASNATRTVPCSQRHTAVTYAVGSLPADLEDADYDDPRLGDYAFEQCTQQFMEYVDADESLAMRTILAWAWFRPSKPAWDDGARWYRCDVVGGGTQTKTLLPLPADVEGILTQTDDQWLVCAAGPTVDGSVKVPCAQPHDWRAVSTIKLGEPSDPYPGDAAAEKTTRAYCSKSVAAWLGYPVDYDFGYTWFHEAEWTAGNRRSVCWARTSQ